MTTEPTKSTRTRTFLFADVRGYTRFTREHGDSEAARLATRFAQLAREAVASRSGRVVELRGDEVMAVFDDELQAVRASLELQATLTEEMASDASLPLNVGIGIDAGEAVPVGDGFRGSALNLAARLCARAEAGQVLVSATVWGRCAEAEVGRFRPLGAAELKGFEQPVDVFEVVSESGRLETPPRLAAPAELPQALLGGGNVVGRDDELDWLRGAWRGARRGAGRMVAVSGPEGMGKSSLAAAFAGEVAGEGYAVLYAGSGGAALAELGDVCRRVRDANRPVLAVVDDVAVLGDQAAGELAATLEMIGSVPALVLCLVAEEDAAPALAAVIADMDVRGDGRHALAPLEASAIERIAMLYAGDDADQVPLDAILRASGGTPARVHELLDAWAGEEAARRLEAAAEWLAVGRNRRSAGLAFANNAIERRLAHLYEDAPAPAADPPCPYKGLAAFDEHDAAAFFGRERLVGELAARTVGSGLLALVGPSGSGKSSLMLAGLLPSLHAGLLPGSARWKVATLRPGPHPLAELGESLLVQATSEERLVVAVDQFEETFTLCASPSERAAFIDELAALANEPDRFIVVLAVRGDFLDRIAAHPALADLVSANQVLVPPMGREDYRRAIEQPARRAGVRVESSLTEALLDEAAGEPGALPLLSTALVELWNQRRDGWMRMESFASTGGLHGAVARLAEASYAQLDDAGKRVARRVFLRLAGTGEGDAITRARVPIGEFEVGDDPVVATVIDRFVTDRLLIRDEQTLEVSHEALLREWPRLHTWLDDEGQGRLVRQHLTQAAHYWDDNGRRTGDLYRAERLGAAQTWSAEHGDQLNALEREFLDASQSASTREIRRLRIGVAVLALLLAAAVVAGIVALGQRRSAQSAANRARVEAQHATADKVGVQAQGVNNLSTGLLLAAAAERLHPSPQTDAGLINVLTRAGTAITTYHLPTRAQGVVTGPDGRTIAVPENNGHTAVFDAASGRLVWQVPAIDGARTAGVTYAPDGHTLVVYSSGKNQGLAFAVDVRTHKVLGAALDGRRNGQVSSGAVSPDGRTFAAISVQTHDLLPSHNPELLRWTLPDLQPIGKPVPMPPNTSIVGFTGADRLVTSRKASTTIRSKSGRAITTYPVPPAALSPDRRTVAVVRGDRIGFLDLATGHLGGWVRVPGNVDSVAFLMDGRTLAVLSGDQLRTVDPRSGAVTKLGREPGGMNGLAVAPDGASVYTSSLDDKAAVRWGLEGGRLAPAISVGQPGNVPGVVSVGSGGIAATLTGHQGTTKIGHLWNVNTGRPVGTPLRLSSGSIGWIAVSPVAPEVAAVDYDSARATIWSTSTGAVLRKLAPPAGQGGSAWISYSADGKLLAIGTQTKISTSVYEGGNVDIWDTRSWKLLRSFRQPGNNGVSSITFSGDDKRVMSAGATGSVAIWSVASGRRLRAWHTSDGYTEAAVFAPHGDLVATGGFGGGLISLWHARTARTGHDIKPAIVSAGALLPVGFYAGGRDLAVTADTPVGEAQLWDLATRREIGTLTLGGPPGFPPGAVISPDGRTLFTIDHTTGLLTRLPLSPSQWAIDACRIANAELTRAEWNTYLGGLPYQRICPG